MPYLFWVLLTTTTFLLLIELEPSKGSFPHADKLVHAFLFLTLSGVGYLAFPKTIRLVLVSLAFYGIITEVLQHMLTVTRHASVLDWAADVTGILLCVLIIRLFKLGQT